MLSTTISGLSTFTRVVPPSLPSIFRAALPIITLGLPVSPQRILVYILLADLSTPGLSETHTRVSV